MDDRIGTQLGNYRLLRLLGQGGFADVYLGEHIHLHTQAAIKVLQVRLVDNNVQSFLNEARTIAHLVHPHIVRVLDFGVQANIPFLVMDYAPKGTLRQRFLHGQPLPAALLFPFIQQAAEALQYAHDRRLIHRDVKPENMLLGPRDEILLSDFGFAQIQSSTGRASMQTAGTAAYMAPEQLQGKPCAASDQYALGVVAYEWLTGSVPFQGTFFEIASQHMLTPPVSLRMKVPSISAEIERAVLTALAKDPRQRFPTVRDFFQVSQLITPRHERTETGSFSSRLVQADQQSQSFKQMTDLFPIPMNREKNESFPYNQAKQVYTMDSVSQAKSNTWPASTIASPEQNPAQIIRSTEANSAIHPQLGIFSSDIKNNFSFSFLAQQPERPEKMTPIPQTQAIPLSRDWSEREQSSPLLRRPISERRLSQGTSPAMVIFFLIMLILILGGGAALIYWANQQHNTASASSSSLNTIGSSQGQPNAVSPTSLVTTNITTSINTNPYLSNATNTLVLMNSMSSNEQQSKWQENPPNCRFSNNSYHISAPTDLSSNCFAIGTDYTDFTYEVQMTFISNAPTYSSGGIIFRSNTDQQQYYAFEVYASGRYLFQRCNADGTCTILAGSPTDPSSPAFHVGQANTLAVVANQNNFTFYINHQQIGSSQSDHNLPYTHGMIGLMAHGGNNSNVPTEVAYSNVRVWQ